MYDILNVIIVEVEFECDIFHLGNFLFPPPPPILKITHLRGGGDIRKHGRGLMCSDFIKVLLDFCNSRHVKFGVVSRKCFDNIYSF